MIDKKAERLDVESIESSLEATDEGFLKWYRGLN
ncbi:hypothetical protein ARD00_00889 [Listeria monocytogenes]|nr:hypothetical protein ARD00_00889 [Listeria monocytogenes]